MADVTIYTRQFCGFCTAAKRLLDQKGVQYQEHDATFSKDLRQEMMNRSKGRTTFPQISSIRLMWVGAMNCMRWSAVDNSTSCFTARLPENKKRIDVFNQFIQGVSRPDAFGY